MSTFQRGRARSVEDLESCLSWAEAEVQIWKLKVYGLLADQHDKDETVFSLGSKLAGYRHALSKRDYEKVPPAEAFAEWDMMRSELEILKKINSNWKKIQTEK